MSSLTWPHPHFTGKEKDLVTSFTAVCSAALYSAGPITASRVLLASFPGLFHSEVFCLMDADIKISNKKLQATVNREQCFVSICKIICSLTTYANVSVQQAASMKVTKL